MISHIYIPDETTACSLGADDVAIRAQQLAAQLPEAKLVRNGSRGAFHLEPMVELEMQGRRLAFGPVAPEEVAGLCTDQGTPNVDHPKYLGEVHQIGFLARQTRLTFIRAGAIEPLDFAAWRAYGGGDGLQRALKLTPQRTISEIDASGLRGRGGAAFPAGIKWRTVHQAQDSTRYIVCNADEGDSGTFADRLLMECDPFQLLEGMAIAAVALNAEQGYIYLRSEYPKARQVLQQALIIARNNGLLGQNIFGSSHNFDIQLHVGAGSYICGEETAMLESLEGKRGIVRRKPPLPALQGLHGKPTLVHNVLSLAAATSILAHGAEAYAAHGVGRSRGTMPMQIGGNVRQGGLVEVPFGVSLDVLMSDFAQSTRAGTPFKAAQIGGPLGAYLPPSAWNIPLDYEAFAEANAMLGHGGIVAFGDDIDMGEQAEFAMRFCARESCGKCTPCRVGSSQGAQLIQRIRAGRDVRENRAVLDDLMETMELGSLCALGGLTPMPVRSILNWFPTELGAGGDNPSGGDPAEGES